MASSEQTTAPTPITSAEHVDALLASSERSWLFKHSNACFTSTSAKREFEKYVREHPEEAAGIIVIQEHRDVSDYVTQKLGIPHQSPQIFLLQNGEVLWQATHYGIRSKKMAQAAEQ